MLHDVIATLEDTYCYRFMHVSQNISGIFDFDTLWSISHCLELIYKLMEYERRNKSKLVYDWTRLWSILLRVLQTILRCQKLFVNSSDRLIDLIERVRPQNTTHFHARLECLTSF